MLRTILQHPLLVGTTEVLLDAIRYLVVMAIVIVLLGQLAAGV